MKDWVSGLWKRKHLARITVMFTASNDNCCVLISAGAGWHTHLGILIARFEGSSPPGFRKVHNRVKTEYQDLIPNQ